MQCVFLAQIFWSLELRYHIRITRNVTNGIQRPIVTPTVVVGIVNSMTSRMYPVYTTVPRRQHRTALTYAVTLSLYKRCAKRPAVPPIRP